MAKISFGEASGSGQAPEPAMDKLKRKLVWHMSAYRFPEALGVVAKMLEIEPGHEMALKYVSVLKEKIALDREWQERRDEREANGESSSSEDDDDDSSSSGDDDGDDEEEEEEEEEEEAGVDGARGEAGATGVEGGEAGEGGQRRPSMSSAKRQELKAQLAEQVAVLRVQLEEYEKQQALEGGAASGGAQPPQA